MIRRIATTVTTSLTALVVLAVPALAGSSFTEAEAQADSDHGLTLTITEPESEDYGDTARVTVVPPSSFTVVSCQPEPSWDCTADAEAGHVTFTRTVLGVVGDNTLQFTVHTPKTNGTYGFDVTQADGAEEPTTVTSRPTVTVVGGTDPEPQQDDSGGDDTTDDGGSTDGGTTDGDTSSGDGGGTDSTDDGGSTTDDTTTEDSGTSPEDTDPGEDTSSSASDSDDDTSDSGGSTDPRRTEGRSNGTRLQITPGQSTFDDPAIFAPDVADDPAIAPPSDGEEDDADTGTATMTAIEGQVDDEPDDAGGLPWQQLLGGALLVAGGAVVAVRRWDVLARVRDADVLGRVRGWDPLDRIRRWRS